MLAPSAVALATSTIHASTHPRGAFYLIGRNFLLDENTGTIVLIVPVFNETSPCYRMIVRPVVLLSYAASITR